MAKPRMKLLRKRKADCMENKNKITGPRKAKQVRQHRSASCGSEALLEAGSGGAVATGELAEVSVDSDDPSVCLAALLIAHECENAALCSEPSKGFQDCQGGLDAHHVKLHEAASSPEKTAEDVQADSEMAVIMQSVMKASHLPEQCSTMLANMLPFSLFTPADERLECQERVVSMAEETLLRSKSELEADVAAADAKVKAFTEKISELQGVVKQADADFKNWSASWRASLDDVTSSANTSAEILAEKRSIQASADARLTGLRKDIEAMETAFQVHFQNPLKAGKGPQYKELEPFLRNMEIEESIKADLPRICQKSMSSRTESEDAILEQLGFAIGLRISSLTEAHVAESSASAECAAAVEEAERDYSSKKELQDQSTAQFEAALKNKGGGEESLKKGFKANEAIKEVRPQLEAAMRQSSFARFRLVEFETNTLVYFTAWKTRASSKDAADCQQICSQSPEPSRESCRLRSHQLSDVQSTCDCDPEPIHSATACTEVDRALGA
jgi:hypothetical protein